MSHPSSSRLKKKNNSIDLLLIESSINQLEISAVFDRYQYFWAINTQTVLCFVTKPDSSSMYKEKLCTLRLLLWPPHSAACSLQHSSRELHPGRTGHQMFLSVCPGDLQVIDQSAVIMLLTVQSPILILVN